MKLSFLGTKANIPLSSPEHRRHSTLLVEAAGARIMLDCGADWLGHHPEGLDAIVLTHAHPDHADGLREGAACPVFATKATWSSFHRRAQLDRRELDDAGAPLTLGAVRIRAMPVRHSLRAPAVALAVSQEGVAFVYAPDVLALPRPGRVLDGANLYIGDGSCLRRSIVRGEGERRVGHASIKDQIDWCSAHGVPRAIFTHCGRQLLRPGYERADDVVRDMGEQAGILAHVAYDGMEIELNPEGGQSGRETQPKAASRP